MSEDVNTSYSQSFAGDCSSTGNIVLSGGNDMTCTIINTYIIPPIVAVSTGMVVPTVISIPVTNTGNTMPIVVFEPAPLENNTTVIAPIVAPILPNTGLSPQEENVPWNMIFLLGFVILIATTLIVIKKSSNYIE